MVSITELLQNAPDLAGGVAPVGVVEPFNQTQRGALSGIINAPAVTGAQSSALQQLSGGASGRGFMQALQNAIQQQQAGTPSGANIAGNFAQGRDLLTRGTQGLTDEGFTSGIGRYLNPFTNEVINRSISDINRQGDIRSSNLRGRSTPGQRSFGTTAQGTQQGLLDQGILDTIGDTTSNLRFSGFNRAADQTINQFNTERGRDLAGSQLATQAGATGIDSLNSLISNAISGNQANRRNFSDRAGNRLDAANIEANLNRRALGDRLGAGTTIQGQNQLTLDVLRPEIEGRRNFDAKTLADLGNQLGIFLGGSSGGTAGSPDLLSKLGGAGLGISGLLGEGFFNTGGSSAPGDEGFIPTRKPF